MNSSGSKRDVGGMMIAAIFIALGVLAVWDTYDYVDPDSYVFPRTIAGVMIVFCIILIIFNLVREVEPVPTTPGSTGRRVGLVVTMLASTMFMPYLGLLFAGLISFAVITLLAMYDPWTRFRVIVYPIIGASIVMGFYFLFSKVLLVPLPTGTIFDS